MRLSATLAAALLYATTALGGCGSRPAEGPPDPAAGEPRARASPTAIPEDFPLTSGLRGPFDNLPDGVTLLKGAGWRALTLCDLPPVPSPLRAPVLDQMIAYGRGGGTSATKREAVLLGDPESPRRWAQVVTHRALECTGADRIVRSKPGDLDREHGEPAPKSVTVEVRRSAFGPTPSATLVKTFAFDGQRADSLTIIQVVAVGNAWLVSLTYGEWRDAEAGIASTVEALSGVVDALKMCPFTQAGC